MLLQRVLLRGVIMFLKICHGLDHISLPSIIVTDNGCQHLTPPRVEA